MSVCVCASLVLLDPGRVNYVLQLGGAQGRVVYNNHVYPPVSSTPRNNRKCGFIMKVIMMMTSSRGEMTSRCSEVQASIYGHPLLYSRQLSPHKAQGQQRGEG